MSREAMKQALEALETDPISHAGLISKKQAITALRQALETEQEPAKTPADGPVAWSCQCGRPYTVTCISSKPQKKEWVGLTDEEIDAAWRSVDYTVDYEQFRIDVARVIEAKLKEKNT